MSHVTLDTATMAVAQEYAARKHKQPVDSRLLRSLIEKVAVNKEKMPFTEAMRFSLNELRLRTEGGGRELYRCAAAKYFSEHSAQARRTRVQANKPPKQAVHRPSVTGTPTLEGNQWAFKF